jgi:hypothetical protein
MFAASVSSSLVASGTYFSGVLVRKYPFCGFLAFCQVEIRIAFASGTVAVFRHGKSLYACELQR